MKSKKNNQPYRVGLVGLGTIGTGVAKILLQQNERISRAACRNVELVRICDKDLTRGRGLDLPPGLLTDDLESIANDPSIDLAVELVGGVDFARTLVLSMLEKGKNIVTANKALLANCGTEIFSAARKYGKTIAFEAAVCGGIPILGALETTLQANRIQSIHAIVNGTCNYILTQMEEKGTDYIEAIQNAQQLGYAEADPTLDVDGSDATQKLAILAQLGYRTNVDWRQIPKQGIQEVEAIDIQFARELGYKIRLLAVAELDESPEKGQPELELFVSPTLVLEESSLADVRNAFNAVKVFGDVVGPVFFHGYGAGELPTTSSVLGDIINTALGRTAITFSAMNYWAHNDEAYQLKDPNEIVGKTYLRLLAEDRPGVLHEISGVLGRFNISIAAMIQRGPQQSKPLQSQEAVPLIITTHDAKEGDMLQAIEILSKLSSVKSHPVRMRVRE